MNIYEKLAAITAELTAVAKNLNVGVGKSSYKAVGEADVLAAVKPLEAKYRVYSFPASRKIVESGLVPRKIADYNGNERETSNYFMRVETAYRFVDIDDPTQTVEITTYGDGIDTGDKAPGKAMTYGDKYALLKAYKIITGDDPDQTASGDGATVKPAAAKTATPKQLEILRAKYTGDNLQKLLDVNGLAKLEDMPMAKASDLIQKLGGGK